MNRRRARVDARLALPAATTWVAAVVLVTESPRRAVAVAATATVALLACASLRRWLPASAVLGVATGAATAAVHVAALHRGPVAAAAADHRHVRLLVRLVRDPVAVVSRRGHRLVVADATATAVGARNGQWLPASSPVVLFAHDRDWLGLLPGQRARVDARLAPPRPADGVAAVGFTAGPPRLVGRPPPWQRVAGRVRAAFRAACAGLPPDERGLVPGLVIGDVAAMPPALTTDFRLTGLTHLNAVSGANVAIVLASVAALVRRVGAGRRARSAAAAAALVGYVVLVRPSPSVLRAAVMGGIVIAGALAGRPARSLPVLSAAVLGLVVVDPFLARRPGFALSVLATFAIVTLAPRLAARMSRRLPAPVATAVAIPVAAQLACTPVIVAAFGQLTPLAVPANLLAAPVVAPATLAGVVCAVFAVPVPALARVFAWAAAVPAAWLAGVARALAAAPGAGLTWPRGLGGVALLAGCVAAAVTVARARSGRRLHGMLGSWPP